MPQIHQSGTYYTNIEDMVSIYGFIEVYDGNIKVGFIPYDGPNDVFEMLTWLNGIGITAPVGMIIQNTCYGITNALTLQEHWFPDHILILPKFQGNILEHYVIQHPPQLLDEHSRIIIHALNDGNKGPWVLSNMICYSAPKGV